MATSRFEFLKESLAKNPTHAFSRYGLAMEYVSQGSLPEAIEHFRKLIDLHPDYTAAYYHGGQTLVKLGQRDEAVRLFRSGIAACERKGDGHTKEELLAAIAALGA